MEEKRDGFVVIREFMWRDLGLSGVPLLVFARAHGFCLRGEGLFYESKARTASFFGVSERTVFRAIRELVGLGLIEEVGTFELGSGRRTKAYRICQAALPEEGPEDLDDMMPWEGQIFPDDTTCQTDATPDTSSYPPMADCHPIHKRDNKNF
ncbi:MAG: hypothetical protein IJ113_07970 [Eggerthellaceae bacterium]|nr:hypothetical protein [Eggerthellaceae bacterium]